MSDCITRTSILDDTMGTSERVCLHTFANLSAEKSDLDLLFLQHTINAQSTYGTFFE